MTDDLATAIFISIYVFGVVPLLGRALSGCSKQHWVGHDYEPCMIRGLMYHLIVFMASVVVWAIWYKLTK